MHGLSFLVKFCQGSSNKKIVWWPRRHQFRNYLKNTVDCKLLVLKIYHFKKYLRNSFNSVETCHLSASSCWPDRTTQNKLPNNWTGFYAFSLEALSDWMKPHSLNVRNDTSEIRIFLQPRIFRLGNLVIK
jgi:hypothetical protein